MSLNNISKCRKPVYYLLKLSASQILLRINYNNAQSHQLIHRLGWRNISAVFVDKLNVPVETQAQVSNFILCLTCDTKKKHGNVTMKINPSLDCAIIYRKTFCKLIIGSKGLC